MPAKNHRGNITVSTGFLNERNATLAQMAQEMAGRGWRGENWNPEDSLYDEAVGPADRVGRPVYGKGVSSGMALSDEDMRELTIRERTHKGEN